MNFVLLLLFPHDICFHNECQPLTFAPNQVIKGWTEALQLMDEGAKVGLFRLLPDLFFLRGDNAFTNIVF